MSRWGTKGWTEKPFWKQAPGEEASQDPAPKRREVRSVACIGKSITIRGDVSAEEDLVLEGRVDGQVSVPNHHLTIGPNTEHAQSEMTARAVTIHGRVTGDVIGKEGVEIGNSGRVDGAIVAPRLTIEEGALINGTITMSAPTVEQQPEKEVSPTPAPDPSPRAPTARRQPEVSPG
jgi:cytoskeletal protein CcmA (bactofilin family)